MNWKKLFRKQLISTKKHLDVFTIFDNDLHNRLLELTEDTRKFDINDYFKAWLLQGDEKYIGLSLNESISSPHEILVINYNINCKLIIKRDYIISPCIGEFNIYESQIYSFMILKDDKLVYDSGLISPLEKSIYVDYPFHYKFKNIDLELYKKLIIDDENIDINTNFFPKCIKSEITYDLLNPIFHIQKCNNGNTIEHILIEYDNGYFAKIVKSIYSYIKHKNISIETIITKDNEKVKIIRQPSMPENVSNEFSISWIQFSFKENFIKINPSITEKFFGIHLENSIVYPTNITILFLLVINLVIVTIYFLIYPFI